MLTGTTPSSSVGPRAQASTSTNLGYLKQLPASAPISKVIITSATIDPQRFSRHFNKGRR